MRSLISRPFTCSIALFAMALASSAGATSPSPSSPTDVGAARDYYLTDVDAGVQNQCLICHRAGGVAPQEGARLVLHDDPESNHNAFLEFLGLTETGEAIVIAPAELSFAALLGQVSNKASRLKAGEWTGSAAVDGHWVLAKVLGQEGHGGGTVLTPASSVYWELDSYLGMLGQLPTNEDAETSFWRGTAAEEREITLRRASLLLAGAVPTDEALSEAQKSDAGLRQQVFGLMEGKGFRDFIVRGADDRLLVSGLLNGLEFGQINLQERYPKYGELLRGLPWERPEEYRDIHDEPFFTSRDAGGEVHWAIAREPLELIAYIITNDLPYTEVLTADYTMVNALTDLVYRSGSGFSHEFTDERGFYDKADLTTFKPGYNNGSVPLDEYYGADDDPNTPPYVTKFSDYVEVPHAGILSTHAWLARYPSTDTNRNRARARWTYLHFLGVDIEKSAPRSTDPAALADTNNPTMNNSACAICHQRLDPVAGAYQSFGNFGGYLDAWGGQDTLTETYKRGHLYQEGDTWYRDMRAPGLEGALASDSFEGLDSLQWLGEQIVTDPRFAPATVRFWWPAIYGSDPLLLPENTNAPDYREQLNAFSAQEAEIGKIADRFEASGYNARSLFADMIMSRWYRHSEVTDPDLVESRLTEVATIGRGRLLTPEELDSKNRAVFGRTWRQLNDQPGGHHHGLDSALSGEGARFKSFYGGIDGAGVTVRNREMTPLMSNVAEAMAVELACQVVLEDFNRPQDERHVFKQLDRNMTPGQLTRAEVVLPGKLEDPSAMATHEISVSASTVSGSTRLRISDITESTVYEFEDGNFWRGQWVNSLDGEGTKANLVIQKIEIRHGNTVVKRIEADEIPSQPGFAIDTLANGTPQGFFDESVGWVLQPNAWVEFSFNLAPGAYEVELFLGTQLLENSVADAMVAAVSLTATENLEETPGNQAIRAQIAAIFQQAMHRRPSDEELNSMMAAVTSSAADAARRYPAFTDEERCHSMIIDDRPHGFMENSVYYDTDHHGMMRGWTVLVHAVLTSWGYLHD